MCCTAVNIFMYHFNGKNVRVWPPFMTKYKYKHYNQRPKLQSPLTATKQMNNGRFTSCSISNNLELCSFLEIHLSILPLQYSNVAKPKSRFVSVRSGRSFRIRS
ncbi:hypothetical protein M758_11G009700 [Ceratodon purpureus]|nr:hypothetical protein M758_11G009700 [Ceratodon purpureus]